MKEFFEHVDWRLAAELLNIIVSVVLLVFVAALILLKDYDAATAWGIFLLIHQGWKYD